MSLQGPIIVIADPSAPALVVALGAAGAFPVVEATRKEAPAAIGKIVPAAIVLADADASSADKAVTKALDKIRASSPYMPILQRVQSGAAPTFAGALPIAMDAEPDLIVARLTAALRVRTLDASVRRRADALRANGKEDVPQLASDDPLTDATVLVLGRGKTYPELTVAVGERVGLIGALGVETAARYLNARDIDGVLIGDGFSQSVVDTFLHALSDDTRFRDLPVAALADTASAEFQKRLPNMDLLSGTPAEIVACMLPLVRQHALAERLKRLTAAIEAEGLLDPETGLFTVAAFLRDLQRAVSDAHERGGGLSIARFSFTEPIGRRASIDAARLVSRLVRNADFACRADDSSMLIVFSETTLRGAHVVARRIASVLKHTMLSADTSDTRVDPSITMATLKSSDTVESLIARVDDPSAVAAE